MLSVSALFKLPDVRRGPDFKADDLKALAARLRNSLANRGFDVGDLFGSDIDIWGFSVDFGSFDILVDISRLDGSTNDHWTSQMLVQDPGWRRSTRDARLKDLKKVEWAVHDALENDFRAQNIEWHLGKGRTRPGQGQPTP